MQSLYRGAVLCTAISSAGDTIYSGSTDGDIRCWSLPSLESDPYDSYGNWLSCKL